MLREVATVYCAGGAAAFLDSLNDTVLVRAPQLQGWDKDATTSICQWTGVTCTDGLLTGLNLSRLGLTGNATSMTPSSFY